MQNDPVNFVDPSGLNAEAGGCSAEFSYAQCGGDDGFWGGGTSGGYGFGNGYAWDQVAYGSLPANLRAGQDRYLDSINTALHGDRTLGGINFSIHYGYNEDGSLWTSFHISQLVGGSNRAWELAQEMNRRPIARTFAYLYGGSVAAGLIGGLVVAGGGIALGTSLTTLGRLGPAASGLGAAARDVRAFAPGKWFSHFIKHGREFGYTTSVQYLRGAQRLTGGGPGISTFTRANGDRLFYNAATNEFGVLSGGGVIRTYFRPTDGINYWNRVAR